METENESPAELESELSIEMDSFYDHCCICLDNFYAGRKRGEYLTCCDKKIHMDCLFLLVISGHQLCPLCRTKINPSNYFNTPIFQKLYFSLDERTKRLYRDNIDILMSRFSYRACITKFCIWLYIAVIYFLILVIFFLPIDQHVHT